MPGMQTRIFHFSLSLPYWGTERGKDIRQRSRNQDLCKSFTTNMRAGYLRKNGVPYGEGATVAEYFELAPFPGGGQLLLVTTVVSDPQYLRGRLL